MRRQRETEPRGNPAVVLRQAVGFSVVGVINTLVGHGVLFVCMLGLGLAPVPSNVIGYLCGLACSFALNRRFTFRSEGRIRRELPRFLLAFLLAYASNLAVLLIGLHGLRLGAVAAQLVAAVTYTAVFFALSRRFVFVFVERG